MKNITANDLANRFQEESMYRVDLFAILCKNGLWLTATSGQSDVYFHEADSAYPPFLPPAYSGDPFPSDPFIFYASANGAWERGSVQSKASFDLSSAEMKLTVVAGPGVFYPGTETPLMSIISSGVFDGASIAVGKIFMPVGTYGQFAANGIGVEKVFSGILGPFDQSGRTKFSWRVMDYRAMLNQKTPLQTIQSNCRWALYSAGCTVLPEDYYNAGLVTSVVNALTGTQGAIVLYADYALTVPAPPYYDQGILQFVTGQNAGLWYTVEKQQADGGMKIVAPTIFPVAVDDEYVLVPGCDRTPATCQSKFSNLINFGGAPFVPIPETGV
jgi:uncharacterized phage protein (TIGR02218 family)